MSLSPVDGDADCSSPPSRAMSVQCAPELDQQSILLPPVTGVVHGNTQISSSPHKGYSKSSAENRSGRDIFRFVLVEALEGNMETNAGPQAVSGARSTELIPF